MAGPRLTLIAAVARNGVIGDGNTIPWRLPEDLKRFKALTMGHAIIMGRKTYQSLARPLPGRRNIVLSRDPCFQAPGCTITSSLPQALAAAAADGEISRDPVFVIGGAQVYAAALPDADILEITEVKAEFAGDARFPEVDWRQWRQAAREQHIAADGLAFDFVSYQRR